MPDRLIAVILLAVSGLFYWQSFNIRKMPFAAFEALGAETFPRGVLIVLAVFSLVLLVRGSGPLVRRVDARRFRAWLARYQMPLASLALFAAYGLAIPWVGWLWATSAYLVVMQLVLQPRRGRALGYVLAGSLAFAWGLSEIFERLLHVVLPRAGLF